jgi:hypothetical protein
MDAKGLGFLGFGVYGNCTGMDAKGLGFLGFGVYGNCTGMDAKPRPQIARVNDDHVTAVTWKCATTRQHYFWIEPGLQSQMWAK